MIDRQRRAALEQQVALAIEGEADFDATLADLHTEIAAHPADGPLLRLRAALHDAAYLRVEAWQDWCALMALAPDDRDAALEVARRQCRWAHHIAAAQAAASAGDDDEDDDPDAAEPSDEDVARIEEAGRALFEQLMRQHATDAAFAQVLLRAWDEGFGWHPWRHHTLIQLALAAHPRDRALRTAEALFLASLASASFGDPEQIPPGHFADAMGTLYNAFTVDEALQALAALLAEAEDIELLSAQAGLLVAIDDHAGAVAAYGRLASLCESLMRSEADDEAREALQQRRDEALAQAEACRGGREGYVAAQMAALGESMGRLDTLRLPSADGDDAGADRFAELKSSVAQWQQVVANQPPAPTAEQLAEIERVVQKVAGSVVGTVSFDEIVLRPLRPDELVGGPSPWFAELAPVLEALGFRHGATFENPANSRALGVQAQGQLWTDADGSTAVVVETAKQIRLRRVFSELDDGRLLLSADSRLSSFFSAGPRVELLRLVREVPMAQLIGLHRACLQRRLAETGLRARPIGSLARLAEVENGMRLSKNDYRLAIGIGDTELRGMHAQFPEVFAQRMRAEVSARLAALPGRPRA